MRIVIAAADQENIAIMGNFDHRWVRHVGADYQGSIGFLEVASAKSGFMLGGIGSKFPNGVTCQEVNYWSWHDMCKTDIEVGSEMLIFDYATRYLEC